MMKVYSVHEVLESTKKKLAEVTAERDSLAAQVALLRESYKELSGAINDLDDCESDTEEFEKASANVFAVMQHGYNNALKATPQQALAEIRAEAAENAIQAVLNLPTFTAKDGSWLIKSIAWGKILPFKKEYAAKVRQGGE